MRVLTTMAEPDQWCVECRKDLPAGSPPRCPECQKTIDSFTAERGKPLTFHVGGRGSPMGSDGDGDVDMNRRAD